MGGHAETSSSQVGSGALCSIKACGPIRCRIRPPSLFANAPNASHTIGTWLGSSVEGGLGKPQLRQRSKRISPTYVRNDVQFEHRDCRELNMMIFRLARCSMGTEIPLLPHDFPEGLPAIRRPPQDVLLREFSSSIKEIHPDAPQPLLIVEEKPDRLLSRLGGAPPRSPTW